MRALVLLLFLVLAPAPAARAQRAYDFARADRVVIDSLARLGGGAEVIVVEGTRVVHRRSVGAWDSTRAVPIASASKWLAGAVVMSLVDDGLLSLDDPVSAYLPAITGARGTITVRQLFSHTSGLAGAEPPCLRDRNVPLAACAAEIAATVPLVAAPGTRFIYGGTSMQLGGRIAEIAGGAPWDSLFARRIARPLGMRRTAFEPPGSAAENPMVGGGAWSTADDYARFVTMLLGRGVYNGRRVLSDAAVAALVADQTGGARILYTPYQQYAALAPGLPATRYGIGNWRERVGGQIGGTSGGLHASSSQGAFGWSPWVDWARGTAGVLAVLGDLPDVMPTYLAWRDRLDDALGTPTGAAPVATPADRAGRRLDAWPVPARTTVTFHFDASARAERLTLYDLRDRVAARADVPAGVASTTVPVADLVPGVYVARIGAAVRLVTVAR